MANRSNISLPFNLCEHVAMDIYLLIYLQRKLQRITTKGTLGRPALVFGSQTL